MSDKSSFDYSSFTALFPPRFYDLTVNSKPGNPDALSLIYSPKRQFLHLLLSYLRCQDLTNVKHREGEFDAFFPFRSSKAVKEATKQNAQQKWKNME